MKAIVFYYDERSSESSSFVELDYSLKGFAENCASQGFVYVPPEDIIVPWQRVISIVKQ